MIEHHHHYYHGAPPPKAEPAPDEVGLGPTPAAPRIAALLTLVYIVGLIFRPTRRIAGMGIDSLIVLALYTVGIGGLFAITAK